MYKSGGNVAKTVHHHQTHRQHGSQAIIVVPRILETHLKPGTLAQITIDILDGEA